MPSRWRAWVGLTAAIVVVAASDALALETGAPTGVVDFLGRFHPILVHFPVALILTACAAEFIYVVKAERRMGEVALFLITAAAWISLPAFIVGFAAATNEKFGLELRHAFAVHRIVGITTPVLAFVAAGMGQSTRRSGQVWEQIVYRVFLLLAGVSVATAGAYGGMLVYGAHYFTR